MDPNQVNQNPMGVPVDPMAPQMPADQQQPVVDPMPQAPVDQPQPVAPVSDPGMQAPVNPVVPTEPTMPVEPTMPAAEVSQPPVMPENVVNEPTAEEGGDVNGGQMPPTMPPATV